MTPSQALRKARTLIDTAGWIQHEARTPAGFCALGALMQVGLMYQTYHGFCEAIGCKAISTWNDAPERTKADVLAAFDRAIAAAEAAEQGGGR